MPDNNNNNITNDAIQSANILFCWGPIALENGTFSYSCISNMSQAALVEKASFVRSPIYLRQQANKVLVAHILLVV